MLRKPSNYLKGLKFTYRLKTKYQVTDFCGLPQASFSPGSNHRSCTCPGQFYKKPTAINKPASFQFSKKKKPKPIKDNSAP